MREAPTGTAHRRVGDAARHPTALTDRPALAALQRSAGNAAVVAVVQRLRAGADPPRPVPARPAADPRFAALTAQVKGKAAKARAHPTPAHEVNKAKAAALPPATDKEAQAKAGQAEVMEGAKPAGFDKAGFVAAVKAAIAAQAPKNLEEADEFGSSGKADAVKGQVAGRVTEGKERSAKDIADKTAAPPDLGTAKDKPVTPLPGEPAPALGSVNAAAGMPAKAPAEQTDFSGGKQQTDQQMAEADVTEEQLAKSNEPEFTGAVAAKKEGEAHSATAPAQVRESEAATLTAAKQGATGDAKGGLAALVGTKVASLTKAAAGKATAKSQDETARAKVAAGIKGIFDRTKTEVEAILGALDKEVATRFDNGEKGIRADFTREHKTAMAKYKNERYGGIGGGALWLADKLTSLPKEADQIFVRAKARYEQRMSDLISTIADFIGTQLTTAKDKIAAGRKEIKAFVAQQPKDLQKVAGEAAERFEAQFDQLEGDVDSKQDGLVQDLASKYVEARTAVDEEITAAQEENKGLWDKAKDAIGGAIQTVLKLKDMLLGVLARAAGAIGKIIKDPIGFLGNFVNAVKGGIVGFASRIEDHLAAGLKGWLLGALAAGGIQLPDKWDLQGVVKLVLSILGLTWETVKARIAQKIPPQALDLVIKGFDIVKILMGPAGLGGLWTWVLEKVGDIKEMVMSQIQDMVATEILKAGITWLISLLNPASAFIKACKMIYDVVMFFVEKADQIKEFVDSVLDSVESIASGGVGAVAGHIEKTLAKMVPVLIGFLASLLGLGEISGKIQKILATVQKPVMKVVDWVVGKAVAFGKKAWAGLKKFGGKVKAKGKALLSKAKKKLGIKEKTPEQVEKDKKDRLDKGVAAGVKAVNRFAGKPVGGKLLKPLLTAIRLRYRMTLLEPVRQGEKWAVHGIVNPDDTRGTEANATESAAEVAGLVAAARVELSKAQAKQMSLVSAEREAERESSADKFERKTVASGGGRFSLSGFNTPGAPAAIAALQQVASVGLLSEEGTRLGLIHSIDPDLIPNPEDVDRAFDEMVSGKTPKPPASKKPLSSAARARIGKLISGLWSNLKAKAGYVPQRHFTDSGIPGRYSLSHAEKQIAADGTRAIGVTRPMCPDCQSYFSNVAVRGERAVVIAAPDGIRVFSPDGSQKMA